MLAIVVLAPTQFGFEIGKETFLSVVDPLVWLALVLWLILRVREKKFSMMRADLFLGGVFLAAIALSALRAGNRLACVKELIQAVEYFVAAYLVFSWVDDWKFVRRIAWVWLSVAGAVLVIGVYQYADTSLATDMRVRGLFGNRNIFGGYLAMILPMFLAVVLWEEKWWARVLALGGLLAGFLVNLAGGSYVAMVVALGVVAMARNRWVFVLYSVAAVVLTLAVLPAMPRDNGEKLWQSVSIYDGKGEVARRYKEWHAALDMTRDNAMLGVGAGNYQQNVGRYYGSLEIPSEKVEPDSQNLYLVLASSTGVAGLWAFLGMLMFFAMNAGAIAVRAKSRERRAVAVGLLGLICGFAVNSIWSPLLVRGTGLTLAIALGLVGALMRSEEDTRPEIMDHRPEAGLPADNQV